MLFLLFDHHWIICAALIQEIKEAIENGKLYEGLATAANMRRNMRAMQQIQQIVSKVDYHESSRSICNIYLTNIRMPIIKHILCLIT